MKMKNWMRNAGFTLVELIVVIAVLGILGAGAAVGYSGYVKKANKAADQQMVAEIVYALELAAISDPSSVPGDATLFLDTTGAQVTGSDNAGMSAALANAFGDNWESQLKLQYGQWGLGSTVTAQAKKLVGNIHYAGGLSYTDNVDDLWKEVETILTGLERVDVINDLYGSNATLMAAAAQRTLNDAAKGEGDPMGNFAAIWCNINSKFSGFGSEYTGNDDQKQTQELMNGALVNAAAIKARNYAFANFLINNTSNEKIKTAAAALENSMDADNKVVAPTDFMTQIKERNNEGTTSCFKDFSDEDMAALDLLIKQYYGATSTVKNEGGKKVYTFTPATGDNLKKSQAYRDAMGYYTLMSAVNEAASETSGMDNDTYKKTMAAAVHNTGVLLNDPTMLDRIQGGCVAITVRDGSIWVTPHEIYIGGSVVGNGVGKSTANYSDTVTVTVSWDSENEDCSITSSGRFVLKVGDTGTIVVKVDESCRDEFEKRSEDSTNPYFGKTVDYIIEQELGALYTGWAVSAPGAASVNGTSISALQAGETQVVCNVWMLSIPVKVIGNN